MLVLWGMVFRGVDMWWSSFGMRLVDGDGEMKRGFGVGEGRVVGSMAGLSITLFLS